MNKKTLFSVISVLAIFITGIIAGILIIASSGMGISTGVVLKSDNGTCFLICHNSPIRLSDYSGDGDRFSKYSDGDKILVIHDGIAESYPASTLAKFTVKIGNGTLEDVPEAVITSLKELGWLSKHTPKSTLVFSDEPVFIGNENANLSISVPEGWTYTATKTENDGFDIINGFEISLFHEEDAENNITIAFTDGFGVCGTGLRTEEISVNGYSASMGIYDGEATFSYIVFDDTPGFYVIHNYADALWWQTYEADLRAIFSTLHIAEGILFREEALEIAEKLSVGENKKQYNEFDPATGIWSFVFEAEEASEIIKIDKNGNIA